MAFGFCGVVVLLFDREFGERVLGSPRRWMWLRVCGCADLLRSGPDVCGSGSDVCGSRAVRCGPDLCGSCSGCSQLLCSGPGDGS